jgi:hypothetical protein
MMTEDHQRQKNTNTGVLSRGHDDRNEADGGKGVSRCWPLWL